LIPRRIAISGIFSKHAFKVGPCDILNSSSPWFRANDEPPPFDSATLPERRSGQAAPALSMTVRQSGKRSRAVRAGADVRAFMLPLLWRTKCPLEHLHHDRLWPAADRRENNVTTRFFHAHGIGTLSRIGIRMPKQRSGHRERMP
ncbi:hypothetical protein, partial [Shumkonia mesophila]|uniref:hypothetical protein n=1 Tax=Shumkonia mesophila TaxID=2838854 RepID=UPI0029352B36